jgi:hypothetical protein
MLTRHRFQVDGLILAGGFVRHPAPWGANLCAWCGTRMPIALIRTLLQGYAMLAPWRFRKHPEIADCIWKYVDAFTENRRKALVYRLQLVAQSDFRFAALQTDGPVFGLSGFWDPVVPWAVVRACLRRNCLSLKDYKILWRADHNVLRTGADAAAKLVLRWMGAEPSQRATTMLSP